MNCLKNSNLNESHRENTEFRKQSEQKENVRTTKREIPVNADF